MVAKSWAFIPQGLKPHVFRGHFGTTEQGAEKLVFWTGNGGKIPSGAKAHFDIAGLIYGLKPVTFTVSTFSASCEVMPRHKSVF
jgi:hypothetical protein